jgi:pilus assembly protein Flp/PilA
MKTLRLFFGSEDGATAVEYGLIAALISVAMMGAVGAYGDNISRIFNIVANKIATD